MADGIHSVDLAGAGKMQWLRDKHKPLFGSEVGNPKGIKAHLAVREGTIHKTTKL